MEVAVHRHRVRGSGGNLASSDLAGPSLYDGIAATVANNTLESWLLPSVQLNSKFKLTGSQEFEADADDVRRICSG
jgi:hypothetical protein